jgi:4'-phosphopantetheinyl transferase EntD
MVAGPANRIELRRRPNRPPLALLHHAGRPPRSLSLSITHRHGRAAAIAATGSTRIGIDLERLDAVPAGSERLFLTRSERQRVEAGMSSALLWMLKEASWKALQLAPTVGFHDLQLDIDDDHELRGVIHGGNRFAASATIALPWACHALVTVQIPRKS